jgi:hypothetical protein
MCSKVTEVSKTSLPIFYSLLNAHDGYGQAGPS